MFITWRLHDSLPAGRYFPSGTTSGHAFVAMDRLLDNARTGALYLRQPVIARMVVDAIHYHERSLGHYDLHCYVVMANHVHFLISPVAPVSKLMQSLKRFTAREGNRILGVSGRPFWLEESDDRVVRDEAEFGRIARYIEMNPVKAGIAKSPEDFLGRARGPIDNRPQVGQPALRYHENMLRPFLAGCLLPLAAAASWTRFTSGPFEVMSSAGTKDGRETLVRFEEFRHALGLVLGDDNLQTPQPVRILLFKTGAPETTEPVIRGRDQYAIVLTAGKPISPALFARLTQLFLDTNSARMPERLERGLVELFSTIEVTGIRITLGRPPANPDLDWARVHLLAVDPEYFGNLRVLTYNLRKGVDEDAAFRNAFGKSPEEIEQQAQRHLAAGNFQTTSISPRPMSPQDFPERTVDPAAAQLALADLLLGDTSRTAYRDLIAQKTRVPEAWEGLGMLALRDQQNDEARQDFAAAMEAGAKGANCYLEYARLEPDSTKAMAALEHAVKLNPKLAEPHFLMAQRLTDRQKGILQLKEAAKLDARNLTYWQALAEAYLEAHDFPHAAQAWRSAEQAAITPGDRARMQRKRREVEDQRLDWEAAERQRKGDEEAREIERLKTQARADLRALEARANQGQSAASSKDKVVPWWDGPKPSGLTNGVLKQVDCLGKRLRLVVEGDDRKTVKLLINDPKQIAVLGGAELTLSCGPQNSRRVKIEYFPKTNAKTATAGEVATIEFQ